MKFFIALLLLPTLVQAHPGHSHVEGEVHQVGYLTADGGFMQLVSNIGGYINNVLDSSILMISNTAFVVPMTVLLLMGLVGLIAVIRRSTKQRIN